VAQVSGELKWKPGYVSRSAVQPAGSQQVRVSRIGYKRAFDLVIACALLVLTAPLFGLIALVVKVTSRGRIFFCQERHGLDGRTFTMVKFRSMYANVDSSRHREYFARYLQGESAPGEAAHVFKLRSDPRITPVGRVLRRLGLDELPQLLNVIRGDMSMVGPRPPLEYEVAHYDDRHMGRLSVKPGITGLWQVRGRDVVDFESMVDMDLEYARNMSLWLDVKIVLMTAPSLVWALFRR
jgi:lipopolysaccharide/colanic/teichoic acid biosynthesis glycosyltransferase